MPNKILVANCSALSEKYSANGLKAVLDATKALVAADKNRGLTTQLVDISNAATMKKFKRAVVKSSKNERQCKDAVDAIYANSETRLSCASRRA